MSRQTVTENMRKAVVNRKDKQAMCHGARLKNIATPGNLLPDLLPSEAAVTLLLNLYSRFTRKRR
jgi:hypothetical protein